MSQATRTPARPAPAPEPADAVATVADLIAALGVEPGRIRVRPPIGTATEADLLAHNDRKAGTCELVDGALVEKTMGCEESRLALLIAYFLIDFVQRHNLGVVLGPDGLYRLAPGLVRLPDVSFVTWDRVPGRRLPLDPILPLAPDLAVEILSPGNARAEVDRKLAESLAAGVRAIWLVDPRARTVRVHDANDAPATLGPDQTLEAPDVLPGFRLPIATLFGQPAWPGGA